MFALAAGRVITYEAQSSNTWNYHVQFSVVSVDHKQQLSCTVDDHKYRSGIAKHDQCDKTFRCIPMVPCPPPPTWPSKVSGGTTNPDLGQVRPLNLSSPPDSNCVAGKPCDCDPSVSRALRSSYVSQIAQNSRATARCAGARLIELKVLWFFCWQIRSIDRFTEMQLGTDGMFVCMFLSKCQLVNRAKRPTAPFR